MLLAGLYLAVPAGISGKTPRVFGYEILTMLSASMEPSIEKGSIIIVEPQKRNSDYRIGDIVAYRVKDNPNMMVTHRIVRHSTVNHIDQYVTKGDNNSEEDLHPVASSDIFGRYTGLHISMAGYLLDFIETREGIIIFIIIPLILMLVPIITILPGTFEKNAPDSKRRS